LKKITEFVSQNKKEKNTKLILTFQPFKSNSKTFLKEANLPAEKTRGELSKKK